MPRAVVGRRSQSFQTPVKSGGEAGTAALTSARAACKAASLVWSREVFSTVPPSPLSLSRTLSAVTLYEERCGSGLNGGCGLFHPFVVDADIRQISAERAGRCAKGSASQRHQKDQANQRAPKSASSRTSSLGIDQLI